MHKKKINVVVLAMALLGSAATVLAAGDLTSKFSGQGTIGNTRHNLTQRQTSGGGPNGVTMDQYRNDYQQVCVYCHTPHGANKQIDAPLWNRTTRTPSYTLYTQQTLSQDATQPGPSSLTCLSCHDGQTAVDSIVNMPGSGGYNSALELNPAPELTQSLLDAWNNASGVDAGGHGTLSQGGCLACHTPVSPSDPFPLLKAGATDFSAFALGTDLSNDHPVGVKLPVGPDWNTPEGTYKNIKFFDLDGNGRPGKREVRFYDSNGGGFEVECASCHDPHGVPGESGEFLKTFLRVTADGSAICLTCHIK